MPFLRNMIKASTIKFLFELLSTRSFVKTIEKLRYNIPRFGAILGSCAITFHLMMCFIRRLGKRYGKKWPFKMTEKTASFTAAFLSVLPIVLGLQRSEMDLLKLIFFPLAWRCLVDKLIEMGFMPKFKHGDILAYMITNCLTPYTYLLERHSCAPMLHKAVRSYSRDPRWENRIYDIAKITVKSNIADKYFKGKN